MNIGEGEGEQEGECVEFKQISHTQANPLSRAAGQPGQPGQPDLLAGKAGPLYSSYV